MDLDVIQQRLTSALLRAEREKKQVVYEPNSIENEEHFFQYLENLHQSVEQRQYITIWELLGKPPIYPLNEIPLQQIGSHVNALLANLHQHNIIVDWMGQFGLTEMYTLLTTELMPMETSAIRVAGMFSHYDFTTPQYDIKMWINIFMDSLFCRSMRFPESDFAAPLFDQHGHPLTQAERIYLYQQLWRLYPHSSRPVLGESTVTMTNASHARVSTEIDWPQEIIGSKLAIWFELELSPHGFWDIVRTNIIDEMLNCPR